MTIELVNFDVNQTMFPSEQSKKIWHTGKHILPLEITLASITGTEMRDGCIQIYQLTNELYSDMYRNPERYPQTTMDFIFNRLITFGALIDESGYNWIMPCGVFNKHIRHHGDYTAIFKLWGFKTVEVGSNTILSNNKYPLFLKYYHPLYKSGVKYGISATNCDFRILTNKFKHAIDDVLRVKADRIKVYFKDLHEYAISKGTRLYTHFQYRKFRYMYKSECVMVFEDWYPDPSVIVLYNNQYSRTRDPWTSFDLFMTMVDKQPDKDELTQYLQEYICVTDDASSGHWVEIHGARRNLAVSHTELCRYFDARESPGAYDYDVQMLKRMIDIRIEQIDHYER